MKKQIIISLKILLILTLLTGICYPLLITAIAQMTFKNKADGSLVITDNKIVGSSLIGQSFNDPAYFWSRPSAVGYNPLPSGGSNLGLTNEKLREQVKEREQDFIRANDLPPGTIVPSEMIFSSGSGLDPHISPEAAFLQIERVVKARNFTLNQEIQLQNLIVRFTEGPQFHLFGQERINVFMLNLELDKIQ